MEKANQSSIAKQEAKTGVSSGAPNHVDGQTSAFAGAGGACATPKESVPGIVRVPEGIAAGVPQTETKQIHRFGYAQEITRIDEGDAVPVGRESYFGRDQLDTFIIADFSAFDGLYRAVEHEVAGYNLQKLEKWLADLGTDEDPERFAHLYGFTRQYEKAYPENPEAGIIRGDMYNAKGKNPVKLSDIFQHNAAECAEIAALAQGYLQRQKMPSSFFTGDMLQHADREFSDDHTFVVLRGGRVEIYDPAIPYRTPQGAYPSVYVPQADFDTEMNKMQKRLVPAKHIIAGNTRYFGASDGTAVNPQKHLAG